MAGAVEVELVENRADNSAFIGLPYHLYRADACWVPPLRMAERQRWSPQRNASLKTRWVRRFLARRAGHVVGRVAAVVDREFADRWKPGAGFFGFFESVDDGEVSAALLSAAEAVLKQQGVGTVLGPVNLSTQDEVGLLIDGFDRPPTLLSPYNPPWYRRLIEAAGYQPCRDYHAYRWTPDLPPAAAVGSVAGEGAGVPAGLVLRTADPRRWADEVRMLHGLYNASFAGVWGFVPITWDEFSERAESFKPFYRPELVVIAEAGGVPAGFGLVLPDVNEALRGLGGRLLPFGWLRLMRRVPRIRSVRFILLGVHPAQTGHGIAARIALRMIEEGRKAGLREGELSLVLDDNVRMRRIIEGFGFPRTKTFRLYEKSL
jgi:GNAT superfamily N-acetyltransferase